MGRFLAGLLLGLAAGAAGVWFLRPAPAPAPSPPAVAEAPETPRRPRRPRGPRSLGVPAPTQAGDPVAVTAEDLRTTSAGDALRAAPTTVDMSSGEEPRDFTQDEIDGAFGRGADELIRCITEARGGAAISGRVVAGVVVGADGRVLKTRVEAPAYLLHHGLYGCARGALQGLRFPAAGKESVVTVPFNLSE